MCSGIQIHQQQSEDPHCHKCVCVHVHEPKGDADRMDFEVDPRGDIFGDYKEYSAKEFGLKPEEVGSEENEVQDGDSDDDEGKDIDEASLEPDQLPNPVRSTSSCDIEVSGATQEAHQL